MRNLLTWKKQLSKKGNKIIIHYMTELLPIFIMVKTVAISATSCDRTTLEVEQKWGGKGV